MSSQPAPSLHLPDGDLRLGSLYVSPSRRLVQGPAGTQHLQPQVMAVFDCLAKQCGRVVTRRALFESCWGNAPVGDDSLNRALSAIRQALLRVGASDLAIETIPRSGYRLALRARAQGPLGPLHRAVHRAFDCWRLGLPQPDVQEIQALESALDDNGRDPHPWGILALLLRKAAEYADARDCASYVARCERAARHAQDIDPREPNAGVALAGLLPLFGNWVDVRVHLTELLASSAGHVPGRHDLAVLEMATGRPGSAVPLIAELLAEDGFAATFHYKRIYHLWTLGDVRAAEQASARAMHLWPHHPAIWAARLWMLLFTGRADEALRLTDGRERPPAMPAPAADFLSATALVVSARESGDCSSGQLDRHVARCLEVASFGPAHAVSSMLSLCALGAVDEAFTVARGYYLGEGSTAVPVRWNTADPSITDQHRRVTQPLFIPAARKMREDSRFLPLCEDIGLAAYWDRFGILPDFLNS